MKTLNISSCSDCPFFLETIDCSYNYCKEMKKYFDFKNETEDYPAWCPLPDASQLGVKKVEP